MKIVVQLEAFNPGEQLDNFRDQLKSSGALVSFSGMVRDIPGGLAKIKIEHYPGMTEKAINKICKEACLSWELEDIMVIHRFGNLKKGELIMMIATAANHRTNAFEAAEFLMDYLKSRAPFWKKEVSKDHTEWVQAKSTDEAALAAWSRVPKA